MPRIAVQIPALLQDCVGNTRQISIEADRLDAAIARIREDFPLLRAHVWDDAGNLRQHVLIFYNDTSTKWLERLDMPLNEGDRVTIVQAISGG